MWNNKAKQWVTGRKDIFSNIKDSLKSDEKKIWFHCASLGEFEQAKPVIEGIKSKYPDYKIFLTFFSPSGYEIKKTTNVANYIFYLPLDSYISAKRFIKLINPSLAIFVKYEFWWYYLHELKNKNIPTFLISGNFRKEQLFFKWYGKHSIKMLKCFTHLFVQREKSKALLEKIGIKNVSVAHDTRFDRVFATSKENIDVSIIKAFKEKNLLIIGGSTWSAEETILTKYISKNTPNIKYIIAPHEIKEVNITKLMAQIDQSCIRYSKATKENVIDKKVLIIDNIGLLAKIYKYADATLVGGAFDKGLHNILEPAAFGIPTLFGPQYEKYPEAVELIELGSMFSIKNFDEFYFNINRLIDSPQLREDIKQKTLGYVSKNLDGSKKILSYLDQFL